MNYDAIFCLPVDGGLFAYAVGMQTKGSSIGGPILLKFEIYKDHWVEPFIMNHRRLSRMFFKLAGYNSTKLR